MQKNKRPKPAAFHTRLQRWYDAQGRHDLPWRNTDDPYKIYVSEVMLQQTQVETVRTRFYTPFLKRFPTLSELAAASEQEVLSLWQGLGYYRRAGHLHAAAKQCGGKLPKTAEGLMQLPGIGRNTAHAIAAFAYHHPVAVMEANVKRVLCRIFAMPNPSESELWGKAEMLLNRAAPFDYNQAMMDLGAMICTRRAPKCGECPASSICEGKGNPESYPQAKVKKKVPVRKRNILVQVDDRGKFSVTPRSTKFLQGLYHFTEQDTPAPKHAKKIGEIEQSYSHFTLQAEVWLVKSRKKNAYSLAQLQKLPMSMAEKKILRLLAPHGTKRA
ncbi:MAG: A/G-specific adenine glycosylase [Alphaproteobacteria bacterium]|nr:A/G-specific adenine glycosylase [Alphaproteobacteria bacterium]